MKYQIKAVLPAVLMRAKQQYSQLKAAGASAANQFLPHLPENTKALGWEWEKTFVPRNSAL